MNDLPMVAIVDDDASIRRSLLRVVQSAGYGAEAFASAREFLEWLPQNQAACLVLEGKEYRVDQMGRGNEQVRPSLFRGLVVALGELWA